MENAEFRLKLIIKFITTKNVKKCCLITLSIKQVKFQSEHLQITGFANASVKNYISNTRI